MAKIVLIGLLWCIVVNFSHPSVAGPSDYHGFCFNMRLNKIHKLNSLRNCTVVVGNLEFVILETTTAEDFVNMTFPKLKEVTGYLVFYRVKGLRSLKDLIPNLARIRGHTLIDDYAFIVNDMPDLMEVNLNSLLKIDRGGVIIWAIPAATTCYVHTIDWNVIAPNTRHVLSKSEKLCNPRCSCTNNLKTNKCWNNKKCQIFLEGPDSNNCSSECFGCRNVDPSSCTLCREFTYNDTCVSRCPNNTYLLTVSNYCVTDDECFHLAHWVWNNTCVSECPIHFVEKVNTSSGLTTCVSCPDCHQTCGNLTIQGLSQMQNAEKCVYVDGSLSIHVSSLPNLANELRYYLRNVVEVSDYIHIYSSISLTSFDFMSSLKRIKGRFLFKGRYSLVVHDMRNLQTVFLPNVTENLKVDKGTVRFYRNPMLCMHEIKKVKDRFPKLPNEIDIPQGLNGYSGGCYPVTLNLKIKEWNETFATATFHPLSKDVHYTLLYVRIPHGINCTIVPETCSDFEWFVINIFDSSENIVKVPLPHLRPASNYAVCIEQYEPTSRNLSRSNIVKFQTLVGKPEPPFILELVAFSSNVIVVRWVDHLDYKSHVIRYELDVILIGINDEFVNARNYCDHKNSDIFEMDDSRHAKVKRPPKNYEKGSESIYGVLSSVTMGAMVEDHFDVCDAFKNCNEEYKKPENSTINGVVKTLTLEMNSTTNEYHIDGLVPFRDYRIYLRGCTKDLCSRSASDTVRTLYSQLADVAYTTSASVDTSGNIFVKWNPPKISNGPVLSYTVEVILNVAGDMKYFCPKTLCVPGNVTDYTVTVCKKASKYIVRICSTTLAQPYICNEWTKIVAPIEYEASWWWSGILIGLFLCVFSCVLGYKLEKRMSDTIPLFNAACYRQESEPAATMASDFMPIYRISWHELRDVS